MLYLTERASFRLTLEGVALFEIAPAVDLRRDVLDQTGFMPKIAAKVAVIPVRHFAAAEG